MADVKEAVGATARLFWIYQAFALAAALLAFLPDRSATYTQAISELRRLAAIHIRADDVDAALAAPAEKAIGAQIFAAFNAAARAKGLTLSKSLKANASYILVEHGPQTISFDDTKVGDLLDALDAYAQNPHYVVVAPEPNALKTELQQQFADTRGAVTSFSIPCNYAPDRCQGDVYVNPNGDMTVGAQRDLQFFVPRVRVELNFGTRDLVEARNPALGPDWMRAPALAQLRDELAELSPAAAIAKLQDLRKAEDRPISIFDVSLSGSAARLVAPIALAVLALAAWASASGLKRLGASADAQETLFLPLIRTPPATVIRWGSFWFPLLVGEGLVLRAWNTGLFGWLAAVGSLGVQSWAVLAMYGIFGDLRTPRAPRPTGWHAWVPYCMVGLSIVAAVAWSIAAALVQRPSAVPTVHERPPNVASSNGIAKTLTENIEDSSAQTPAKPTDASTGLPPQLPPQLPTKIEADEEREKSAIQRIRAQEEGTPDGPR